MDKITKKLEIQNKLGLHARAAALLVQTVNRFAADVRISKDNQTVDGRSIMGLLTLAAAQGSKIQVEAEGTEAPEALRAIESLLEKKFHEAE
jgi:phosphocarrier protein